MADTEKITINMSPVDLGQVDLLVSEGFYSNRTDFIRTAIRNQINFHADTVKETVKRKIMVLGVMSLGRKELEDHLKEGRMNDIRVVGSMSIAPDVPVQLALATIHSIQVFGTLSMSSELRAALGDRIL
jgi:Arc/MetJ-type ribon-helix-helix transcriptional regulator